MSVRPALLLAVLAAAAARAGPPSPDLRTLPASTPVSISIDEEVASNRHRPGDRFRISVAEDVMLDGAVVVAAGTPGEGEVIHAAKSGAGGKAGELILAARFVRVGDVDVRLRSFSLGAAGKDRSVNAIAVGTVAGPFALFIKGGAIVIPPGTIAMAKTAQEFQLPAMAPAPAPAPESASDENESHDKGGEDEQKTD